MNSPQPPPSEQARSETPSLLDLPPEILYLIFSWLGYHASARMGATCRAARALCLAACDRLWFARSVYELVHSTAARNLFSRPGSMTWAARALASGAERAYRETRYANPPAGPPPVPTPDFRVCSACNSLIAPAEDIHRCCTCGAALHVMCDYGFCDGCMSVYCNSCDDGYMTWAWKGEETSVGDTQDQDPDPTAKYDEVGICAACIALRAGVPWFSTGKNDLEHHRLATPGGRHVADKRRRLR